MLLNWQNICNNALKGYISFGIVEIHIRDICCKKSVRPSFCYTNLFTNVYLWLLFVLYSCDDIDGLSDRSDCHSNNVYNFCALLGVVIIRVSLLAQYCHLAVREFGHSCCLNWWENRGTTFEIRNILHTLFQHVKHEIGYVLLYNLMSSMGCLQH